jgi:uncharacterized protein with PIN domain
METASIDRIEALVTVLALLAQVEDVHAHRCEECQHRWRHARPQGASEAEYADAHMCPECGKGPWYQRVR